LEDTILGGYTIPKRTSLYLNFHAAHVDPTLWKNPEQYNPDRFDSNPGFVSNFFAFSYGRRNCIGQKFAMNEALIIISAIVQHFDVYMGSGKVRSLMKGTQEAYGFKCKFVPRRN